VAVLADEDLEGLQEWWWLVGERGPHLELLHEHGEELAHGKVISSAHHYMRR
jgi:hypothetical protein